MSGHKDKNGAKTRGQQDHTPGTRQKQRQETFAGMQNGIVME